MAANVPVTFADGDGIGPEIMAETRYVLNEAGAQLEIHEVEIGEKAYLRGQKAGIDPKTWETIYHTKGFLKAPITTPQGGGFKSLNVTIRTTLGLFANVRPCVAYAPFIDTKHPGMDVVVIRENEEDLYTGIEYRQSEQTVHALKIITRPGCEKIIRYAFEYARAYKRKKVTCFTKDNILKLTDGLFHTVFDEIAPEYPDIENEHWIVDIGAAKLADTPENFDVVVMPNLYGDILSDVAAQIAGSVGLAGSANIGSNCAMFEAIHGSAPRRAGQDLANPSGLMLAAVMMMVHIGQLKVAEQMHNAWLKTIEEGIHTYDIYKEGISKEKVGTKEFGQAVVKRLGKRPDTLPAVIYDSALELSKVPQYMLPEIKMNDKKLVGVDVFVDFIGDEKALQKRLAKVAGDTFELKMIANRGTLIWPVRHPETPCVDIWRCRFMAKNEATHKQIATLQLKLAEEGIDFTHTEHLCTFSGKPAYTLAQDEQ